MGWNSWNFFAGKVTDQDIRDTADLLVSTGMRDAGYVYVNIDDTWEGKRDADGRIQSNDKFPDMKALAAYVHSKGLKLGIYSSPGPQTCARFEGSFGHEQQDAQTYADWGIDYLKYSVWEWGPQVGANLWRTTGDISANFDRMRIIGQGQAGLAKFAGPGHWNDPDMLEVGNGKLTQDDNRTHMTLWAMLAAPLLAGNNLREMTPEVAAVLMNKEVIAIDQDPLGRQGDRIYAEGPIEIWARPLKSGGKAVAIFNFGASTLSTASIGLHLKDLGFGPTASARDVWAAKDLGRIKDDYAVTLPAHAVQLLILTK
jgi:alpha-galactosidase